MQDTIRLKYKEYPILCPSCGEPLACYSKEYERLVYNGFTIEDALNELHLMNPCTRAYMMDPTVVKFNIQNTSVIEGRKLPTQVDIMQEKEISTINPVFLTCIPDTKNILNVEKENLSLFDKDSESSTEEEIIITKTKKKKEKGIVLDDLNTDLDAGGILLEEGKKSFLLYPTLPGVPVINSSPYIKEKTEYVGDGKYLTILSGRTYIAR
jgi:DNA-directed RNA polymerase subunit N (RpoN/RPB10)